MLFHKMVPRPAPKIPAWSRKVRFSKTPLDAAAFQQLKDLLAELCEERDGSWVGGFEWRAWHELCSGPDGVLALMADDATPDEAARLHDCLVELATRAGGWPEHGVEYVRMHEWLKKHDERFKDLGLMRVAKEVEVVEQPFEDKLKACPNFDADVKALMADADVLAVFEAFHQGLAAAMLTEGLELRDDNEGTVAGFGSVYRVTNFLKADPTKNALGVYTTFFVDGSGFSVRASLLQRHADEPLLNRTKQLVAYPAWDFSSGETMKASLRAANFFAEPELVEGLVSTVVEKAKLG